jgi:hypothetical protein
LAIAGYRSLRELIVPLGQLKREIERLSLAAFAG